MSQACRGAWKSQRRARLRGWARGHSAETADGASRDRTVHTRRAGRGRQVSACQDHHPLSPSSFVLQTCLKCSPFFTFPYSFWAPLIHLYNPSLIGFWLGLN